VVAVRAVVDAYGRVFGPVAVDVMAPEKDAVPKFAPPIAFRVLAIVVDPVFEIAKSVEVENTPPELVDDDMAKRVGLVDDALASIVSAAYGDDVPSPKLPVDDTQVNCPGTPASPNLTVDDADIPCVKSIRVEVEFAADAKDVVGVKLNAPLGVA
jgi:hypothetical protein